jgi:serine/threonine-protein kinase RsbW
MHETHPRRGPAPPDPGPGSRASLEMRIPARAEWVRVVRLTVAGVAGRMGFSFDEVEDLKLAVAEACNNAILHSGQTGAGEAPAIPRVQIEVTPFPDRIVISITDEGCSQAAQFPDINEIESYNATGEDELPEGGMGLLLIRSLMDEVEQCSSADTQTTLRMVKYLRHEAGDDVAATPPPA